MEGEKNKTGMYCMREKQINKKEYLAKFPNHSDRKSCYINYIYNTNYIPLPRNRHVDCQNQFFLSFFITWEVFFLCTFTFLHS